MSAQSGQILRRMYPSNDGQEIFLNCGNMTQMRGILRQRRQPSSNQSNDLQILGNNLMSANLTQTEINALR